MQIRFVPTKLIFSIIASTWLNVFGSARESGLAYGALNFASSCVGTVGAGYAGRLVAGQGIIEGTEFPSRTLDAASSRGVETELVQHIVTTSLVVALVTEWTQGLHG
jgi:hypothetical protein